MSNGRLSGPRHGRDVMIKINGTIDAAWFGRIAILTACTVLAAFPARAQTPPAGATAPAQTHAGSPGGLSLVPFENAYVVSFYGFDACGDQLAGRIFRKALTERVMNCPFSDEAKAKFQKWSVLQRRKASQEIAKLVEANGGGLPVKLDGMSNTCHEQRTSPEYTALHDKIDRYDEGLLPANGLIPEGCDATSISP
jgi:hypothetical protein